MSNVIHPDHYQKHIVEDILIIEDVVKDYPISITFHIGTALKYILRAPFKGKLIEDLQKSVYYLNLAIAKISGDSKSNK